jgi:hypothetical protein
VKTDADELRLGSHGGGDLVPHEPPHPLHACALKRGQSRQADGPHGSAPADRRVLRLVRSYLTAGVLADGLFEAGQEGRRKADKV